jgi:hypothetical protein
MLVEYASGTLSETAAEGLSAHLEGCSDCQRRVDEHIGRADSLMGVLRTTPIPPTRYVPSEEQLISKAKLLAPARPDGVSANGQAETARSVESQPRPAINASIAAFLATLTRSRLMTREEVDALADTNLPHDARELAKELVAAKRLTSFQASALLRGISRGLVLGNYIILDKLGRGGMGHVYKARHRTMGRIVCIKMLPSSATQDPEMLERFRREARAVAALNHPNIVVGHDAAESDGIHFLVMEFIEGSDLAKRTKERAFSMHEAVDITLQTARALAYAHKQGVVHRDIKPHNLLLDESGNVKILDMGIARFDAILGDTCDASGQATMTNTGVVMGTVDFMSPEQALNTRKADARSDVYSLGCTLYYILTQKPLFGGDTVMEKLVAHRETPPPRLSDTIKNVPAGLEAVFRKMVAKEPRDRYANMESLAGDLAAVQAGQRPKAQSGRLVTLLKRHWKEVSATAAAAAIVLTLFLGGAFNQRGTEGGSVAEADDSTRRDDAARDVVPRDTDRNRITSFNGRGGKFLLMVPFDGYDQTTLDVVRRDLISRGAELVVLSSQSGEARAADGNGTIPVNVTLDTFEFDPDEFNGIIIAGGPVEHEFGHKNSQALAKVTEILNECLSHLRVVATIDDGYQVIGDSGLYASMTQTHLGCCTIMSRDDLEGRVVKLSEPRFAAELVKQIYHQLDRRLTRAEGGPGRALLVVSQAGFNPAGFQHTADALRRAGIEYNVANESGQPVMLRRIQGVTVDLPLHGVMADDYDAIIFCDGNDFGTDDNAHCRDITCGRAAGMIERNRVVAGIGNGWRQLKNDFSRDIEWNYDRSRDGYEIAIPKDGGAGRGVGVPPITSAQHAHDLVAMIFDDLLEPPGRRRG